MLVILKEILTKMYFCMPSKLSAPFYTTYAQHTDFIFGPNLVPFPKSLHNKFQIFHSLFTPQELKIRFLSSSSIQTDVQTQMTIFTCPLLILNTPYPKNSAIMTRDDNKWKLSIWYLHV